ncbi:MAG: SDR family NAD(P)-dependent oxidoreductase [Deltaproteobacteria bacterium]|nr:MAG: SDR family NAD(P)-dependent oxidoreductase [Deltaproteobacteria bacterium]TMB21929.1 MAG: SDR family NAD(P)-dependent oxidoreductase [Deltaproteobacteria bacterium]
MTAGDYRDKVVIVTGASSGIGRVTAKAFAQRGGVVVAVARREELLRQLVRECQVVSPASHYLAGDLGERAFAEHVVDDTVARHGRVDILVNNAGISKHKQIYHMSADEAEQVMRVNFLSCVWTTLAAIPIMLRQGSGSIVNISSFAAKVAPPRETIYAASKAAMNAFSEGMWNDLAGANIHVAIVNPGPIDTEIWLKEDEPVAFHGRKYPPELITQAIFEVIEKRRHELTVPRRNPPLLLARFMRLFVPSVLRAALARFDPVPREVLEKARARAREGKRLGDLRDD